MGWIGFYLEVAIGIALSIFVIADSTPGRRPAPAPVAVSAVAGVAWPVLLVGLAQFFVVVAVAKSLRTRPAIRST